MSHYSSLSLPPLYVRVAEALGYPIRDASVFGCRRSCVSSITEAGDFPFHRSTHDHIRWEYYRPFEADDDESADGEWREARRYDIDWAATGPLIEALLIEIVPPGDPDGGEVAAGDTARRRDGATPLIAVCELIVALAAGEPNLPRAYR